MAPEAGALLLWAISSTETLYYLADLDAAYEVTRDPPAGHHGDVVDVAHARWASGTCITALDLCVAGLARALGGHPGPIEFDLGDFGRVPLSKRTATVKSRIPNAANGWIESVLDDPGISKMIEVRHALTHRRLPRNLHMSVGSTGPDPRLEFRVGAELIPVRQIIEGARDLATMRIGHLMTLIPAL